MSRLLLGLFVSFLVPLVSYVLVHVLGPGWLPSERQRRQLLRERPRDGRQTPHPHTGLTDAEEAEVAVARAQQSMVSERANAEAVRLLLALARRRPELIRRLGLVEQCDVHLQAAAVALARFDEGFSRDGLHDRRARRMRRSTRNLLVIGLGVIDVFAFRAAIEFVFNVPDDVVGRIESLVLSLLSIGMIVATAVLAQAVRNHADRLAGEELGLEQPGVSEPSRRELRWIGWPAGVAAVVLLAAGSVLRLQTMIERPWWAWFAVPAFSTGAMASAFFVEWRWANELLDRRDDLVRGERRRARQARRSRRRMTRCRRTYEQVEQRLVCLAEVTGPVQQRLAIVAAARIAWGRAGRRAGPDAGAHGSVFDQVRALAPGSALLDARHHLAARGLELQSICPDPDMARQLTTSWPAPLGLTKISRLTLVTETRPASRREVG